VHRRWLFRVDAQGRLQAEQVVRKSRRSRCVRSATVAWVGARRLTLRGARWYGMLPTRHPPRAWIDVPVRYRQGPALDARETVLALALNGPERKRFVLVLE